MENVRQLKNRITALENLIRGYEYNSSVNKNGVIIFGYGIIEHNTDNFLYPLSHLDIVNLKAYVEREKQQ